MKIKDRHLRNEGRKEKKLLSKKSIKIDCISKIEEKIPPKVRQAIDEAFYKGFNLVFDKGTVYIEKMYDKEKIICEHELQNLSISKRLTNRNLRKLDSRAKKSKLFNQSISLVEGGVLGFLGMGLPDIPLFIAVILKNIYEICLSYGFNYENDDEKIYILNVIAAAVDNDEDKLISNARVDEVAYKIENGYDTGYTLDEQIRYTSHKLSDALLVSKFIQGFPIVGVVGALVNNSIISKISKYAMIKYKKRFLNRV